MDIVKLTSLTCKVSVAWRRGSNHYENLLTHSQWGRYKAGDLSASVNIRIKKDVVCVVAWINKALQRVKSMGFKSLINTASHVEKVLTQNIKGHSIAWDTITYSVQSALSVQSVITLTWYLLNVIVRGEIYIRSEKDIILNCDRLHFCW